MLQLVTQSQLSGQTKSKICFMDPAGQYFLLAGKKILLHGRWVCAKYNNNVTVYTAQKINKNGICIYCMALCGDQTQHYRCLCSKNCKCCMGKQLWWALDGNRQCSQKESVFKVVISTNEHFIDPAHEVSITAPVLICDTFKCQFVCIYLRESSNVSVSTQFLCDVCVHVYKYVCICMYMKWKFTLHCFYILIGRNAFDVLMTVRFTLTQKIASSDRMPAESRPAFTQWCH